MHAGVAPVLKKRLTGSFACNFCLKKKCCSLANFLWVQSRQFRIVASIKRFLFGEKTFNLHWRTKVLKESVQLPNANNCFCSYLRISTLSQILLFGAQLHLPLVVEEFLPFLLFSLPLLILSENLVLQMPDFFNA